MHFQNFPHVVPHSAFADRRFPRLRSRPPRLDSTLTRSSATIHSIITTMTMTTTRWRMGVPRPPRISHRRRERRAPRVPARSRSRHRRTLNMLQPVCNRFPFRAAEASLPPPPPPAMTALFPPVKQWERINLHPTRIRGGDPRSRNRRQILSRQTGTRCDLASAFIL